MKRNPSWMPSSLTRNGYRSLSGTSKRPASFHLSRNIARPGWNLSRSPPVWSTCQRLSSRSACLTGSANGLDAGAADKLVIGLIERRVKASTADMIGGAAPSSSNPSSVHTCRPTTAASASETNPAPTCPGNKWLDKPRGSEAIRVGFATCYLSKAPFMLIKEKQG